jgi:hypothetical protein
VKTKWLTVLVLIGASATAYAQDAGVAPNPYEPSPPEADAPEEGAEEREERRGPPSIPQREVPDYDGLPEPGPSAEEVLLEIPRAILFPAYLVFEYVLRQPLYAFVTFAEREQWLRALEGFFTWDGGRAGIIPTVFFEFGFQPSVGFRFWWNDLGAEGHNLSVSAGTWGPEWLSGSINDRFFLADDVRVELSASGSRRPDRQFYGVGWDARDADRARFAQDALDGSIELRIDGWRQSFIAATAGVRWREFADTSFGSDISVPEAVQQGRFEMPASFVEGYTAYRQRFEGQIDTRPRDRGADQSGVRVNLSTEQGFDLERGTGPGWVRTSATLGAFADLGGQRTVGLWGFARMADPLGTTPVPFTELVEHGGEPFPFGGFQSGRLRGRSGLASTLEYRYPVMPWLDGQLFVTVGNVFDEHFSDFRFERLRISFGGGLRVAGPPDGLAILIAAGSDPFEQGGAISSVRFAFGGGIDP